MNIRGISYAIMSSALLASIVVIGKLLIIEGADPLAIVFFRALLAFLLLGSYLFIFRRSLLEVKLKDLRLFLLYGLCTAVNYASYFYAFKWISGTLAVILLFTYPTLVVIISAFLFKEKVTFYKIFAVLLTFTGLIVVIKANDPSFLKYNFIGICCGLMAGVSMAWYTILGKTLTTRYPSLTVVCYGFGLGALFLFLGNPVSILTASLSRYAIGGIFILAIFPSLMGYALFTLSFQYIEPSRTSIVCTTEPVIAAILAKIFLNEQLGYIQYLGGFLIFCGIIISEIGSFKSTKHLTT